MNENQYPQYPQNGNGYPPVNNGGYQQTPPVNYGGYQAPPTYYQPPYQPAYQPMYRQMPTLSEDMKRQIELRNRERLEKSGLIKDGILFGATILFSLLIQVVLIMLLQQTRYFPLFETSCIFQNSINVLVVHIASMLIPYSVLALILKKRYVTPLIPAKKLDKLPLAAWVSLGMGLCIASNFITNFVIELFKIGGYELTQPEYEKPDSIFAVLIVFVSTAIVPGIIEEFAFRCSVMGALRGRGKFFAVLASSIVFGLMHGNVIQFVFALLVGLALGYITLATDSVIPAMLIHGFNNGLSVISDACEYFFKNGKVGEYTTNVLMILWAGLAIWAIVYLLKRKELILKKAPQEKGEQTTLSFGAKLLCLLPGLALPLIILIVMTAQTVVPIK